IPTGGVHLIILPLGRGRRWPLRVSERDEGLHVLYRTAAWPTGPFVTVLPEGVDAASDPLPLFLGRSGRQMYSTRAISYERRPLGVTTSAVSPSSLPISARAIGELIDSRPSLMSDSSSPTIWYCMDSPLS